MIRMNVSLKENETRVVESTEVGKYNTPLPKTNQRHEKTMEKQD